MIQAQGPVCIAIVPYREQPGVKSRLAGQLTADQRLQLARTLLVRVLDALLASKNLMTVLLVGDAPAPARIAANHCVIHLNTHLSLNESVALGCRRAQELLADEVLIVHADLPTLTADFVDRSIMQGRTLSGVRRAALASCQRRDGTNLLWLAPATEIEFCYGPDSRRRHLKVLHDAGYNVVESPAIADVDTDEDLALLRL